MDVEDMTDMGLLKFDGGAGSFPQRVAFRRAMSVPSTVNSDLLSTKSLSKRPSFRLQLPESSIFPTSPRSCCKYCSSS